MLRNSKATFVRKFVVKTFKNSQIWSHWKRQAFRLEPIFNSNNVNIQSKIDFAKWSL